MKGIKKVSHANIALFIPHEGCLNQCSFCNQRAISGTQKLPLAEDVDFAMKTALESGHVSQSSESALESGPVSRNSESTLGRGPVSRNSEIAFFGGSFTALEPEYMLSLLKAAQPYCKNGDVSGIRISTRPDCVDEAILELLASYNVTAIELGAQSMEDEVLKKNNRGHSAEDTRQAARLIKEFGFSLGLQMMTGLPIDRAETSIKTAREFIALSPDFVRIYPTVVLKGTQLASWYQMGEYVPPSLDESISLCAELLLLFHESDIPVIRLGLHSGGAVERDILAGAYHPAFRELCEGEIYYRLASEEIRAKGLSGSLIIEVNPRERSKMAGQKRKNLLRLQEMGSNCKICENSFLDKYEIIVRENI